MVTALVSTDRGADRCLAIQQKKLAFFAAVLGLTGRAGDVVPQVITTRLRGKRPASVLMQRGKMPRTPATQ